MNVWDRAGIQLVAWGSAVRHITDWATWPGMFLSLQVVSVYSYNEPTTEYCMNMSSLPVHKKYRPHYHASFETTVTLPTGVIC